MGVEEGAIEVDDNEGDHGGGGGNSASATGETGVQLERWEDNFTPGLENQETRGVQGMLSLSEAIVEVNPAHDE